MRKSFRGGVHPFDGKALTADAAVQKLTPTGDAVYPLRQHIGKPALPLVKKGDAVSVGQQIAAAADGLSACICSAVSGTVKAIEPRLCISGSRVMSIVIDNDGQYTPLPTLGKARSFHGMDNGEIRAIARAAGIVGLGGAGFPTDTKLTPAEDNAIEYVLINGAECEPYLTSDYRLMLENTEELLEGIRILLQMFPHAVGVIGIEDNKSAAIKKLTHLTETHPRVRVCPLKTKYPQGGERALIYAVTGRKVHTGVLPYQMGCIVHNVATVIALYRAVCLQTPLISRVITLSGDAFNNVGNFEVPIGTSLAAVVETAGGFKEEPQKLIVGGPMMGTALAALDVPTLKTTSALLAFADDSAARSAETACIRCGRCVTACPAFLVPQQLVRAVRKGDMDRFQTLGGMECISCGSCSYICPAHIRLTQRFVTAKAVVAADRKREKEGKK